MSRQVINCSDCQEYDIEKVVSVLQNHWEYSDILTKDREYLIWSFGFLHGGRSNFYLKQNELGIAGFIFINDIYLNVEGRKHHAVFPSMVRSLEKGTARYLLGELLSSKSSHSIALGGNSISMKILASEGFECEEALHRYFYVVSERKVRQIYKSVGRDWNFAVGARAVVEPTEWREWEPGEAWDETFEKILAPQIIGTWKDTQYMNWRYVTHPRFKYHIKVPPSGKGLIVYRIAEILNEDREPTGWKAMRIVDFLVDPEEGVGMAARLVAEAEKEGCAFIDFY